MKNIPRIKDNMVNEIIRDLPRRVFEKILYTYEEWHEYVGKGSEIPFFQILKNRGKFEEFYRKLLHEKFTNNHQ